MNKKMRFGIIFFILTTMMFGMTLLSYAKRELVIEDVIEMNDLKVENGQIVYRREILTSTPDIKKIPKLSPDGNRVVFAYQMDLKAEKWGKLGIINLSTGAIEDLYLEKNYANAFINIEWLNNKQIAITGHRNPSLCTYEIYDINSKKCLKTFYGTGFTWNKDKTYLIYNIPAPHFAAGEKGNNKVVDAEGNILFKSDSNVMIISNPSISDDEKKVAFFELDLESNDVILNLGQIEKGKEIRVDKKVNWNNTYGSLKWDNSILKITTRFENIYYNTNDNEIIKKENLIKDKKENIFREN